MLVDIEQAAILLLLNASALLLLRHRFRRFGLVTTQHNRRRLWVRRILLERPQIGQYEVLLRTLHSKDPEDFRTYFRMEPATFEKLHDLLKPYLTKMDTHFRKAITSRERLAITLRFMGHGDSQKMLGTEFCVGKSTVNLILKETLPLIWRVLQPLFLPTPTEEEMEECAEGYRIMWNFPNCCGAVDGKHIRFQKPGLSGSRFYCYKDFFSVVLMAVVDPTYKFLMIDVGQEGSRSDGAVFANSAFGKALVRGTFPMPNPRRIGDGGGPLPHVLVGDEAFPLATYMMRPYPRRTLRTGSGPDYRKKKIFNYRLSRARRVYENAFGILAQTWQIFFRTIQMTPRNARNLVKAACVLQNFLRDAEGSIHPAMQATTIPDAADEDRLRLPASFRRLHGLSRNPTCTARQMQERLAAFFSSQRGRVSWQDTAAFVN